MKPILDQVHGRAAVLAVAAMLAACGGGGGSAPKSTADTSVAPQTQSLVGSTSTPGGTTTPGACTKAVGDPPRSTVPGLGQGTPEADAHLLGMWTPVIAWPVIPIHGALTPDGRVLTYGTTSLGKQTGRFNYSVWDPTVGTGADAHLSLPNATTTDIFCSGQILMPQSGRMLLAGGDNYVGGLAQNVGTNETTIFDPATNGLSQGTAMNRARWYGTPTLLTNGDVLMVGGRGDASNPVPSDRPEVRAPDGTFRLLSDVDTSAFNFWYPRGFTARDGRVFGWEVDGGAYFLETQGTGRLSPSGQVDGVPTGATSSAALYAPGKVLVTGGRSAAATTIDFTGPQPVIRPTAPLSAVREYVNLTVLPDGRVLASGGSGVENELVGVTNHVEIWSPTTSQWTRGASGQIARLYHSIGMLLPDASVLVGGGGAPGPLTNTNAEIYFPPYLFEEGGRWAARPTIVSAPTVADPGATVTVQVGGARPVVRLTLVKMGTVTHSLNFEQRHVELPVTAAGNRLTATLPRNVGDLPAGFWMLFAIDDRGVPSVASVLRVNLPADPALDSDWTGTFGGAIRAWNQGFAMSCAADEVLAGVRGTSAAGVLESLSPVCVRADATGRWAGTPGVRGGIGATAGAAFERQCPADQAVVGLEGRAGTDVDSVRVQCAPLAGARTVGATGRSVLPAAGGTGGAEQRPLACAGGKAATGLHGRASLSIAAVGLLCGAPNATTGVTTAAGGSGPVPVTPSAPATPTPPSSGC